MPIHGKIIPKTGLSFRQKVFRPIYWPQNHAISNSGREIRAITSGKIAVCNKTRLEVFSFNKQIFHAVSLSGGKDSTAMLLLMIERGLPINTVLWADTGMEFPEMYDHIRKVDDYLYRERGIHITMLRHPKGFEYLMFEEEKQKPSSIENRQRLGVPLYGNGWPGVKVRWCTGQLKTHLISKEVNRLKGEYQALHYRAEHHRAEHSADQGTV